MPIAGSRGPLEGPTRDTRPRWTAGCVRSTARRAPHPALARAADRKGLRIRRLRWPAGMLPPAPRSTGPGPAAPEGSRGRRPRWTA